MSGVQKLIRGINYTMDEKFMLYHIRKYDKLRLKRDIRESEWEIDRRSKMTIIPYNQLVDGAYYFGRCVRDGYMAVKFTASECHFSVFECVDDAMQAHGNFYTHLDTCPKYGTFIPIARLYKV